MKTFVSSPWHCQLLLCFMLQLAALQPQGLRFTLLCSAYSDGFEHRQHIDRRALHDEDIHQLITLGNRPVSRLSSSAAELVDVQIGEVSAAARMGKTSKPPGGHSRGCCAAGCLFLKGANGHIKMVRIWLDFYTQAETA